MGQASHGNMLLQALRTLAIAILKVLALCFAWVCKICGWVFIKLSEITFKLSEK